MKAWSCILLLVFSGISAGSKDRMFRWRMDTEPSRNYIYPEQTGLQYNLSYLYATESKAMRKYLHNHYDLRTSASIARIFKDVCTGYYFERYFECRVKFLRKTDTLVIKVLYETGEEVIEKYPGGQGTIRFHLHLTRYKNQHDFSTGQPRDTRKKGLVSRVDMSVLTPNRTSGYVMIRTKLYTEADMPGILSHIRGNNLLR